MWQPGEITQTQNTSQTGPGAADCSKSDLEWTTVLIKITSSNKNIWVEKPIKLLQVPLGLAAMNHQYSCGTITTDYSPSLVMR